MIDTDNNFKGDVKIVDGFMQKLKEFLDCGQKDMAEEKEAKCLEDGKEDVSQAQVWNMNLKKDMILHFYIWNFFFLDKKYVKSKIDGTVIRKQKIKKDKWDKLTKSFIHEFSFKEYLMALEPFQVGLPFLSSLQQGPHVGASGVEVAIDDTEVAVNGLFAHFPPDLRVAHNQEVLIVGEGFGFIHVGEEVETADGLF